MPTNKYPYPIYLEKAVDAVREVFDNEYPLLTLPFPKIRLMSEDESGYSSGMYYITIGDQWQIHLNFGKLPKDYKTFQQEVKVLTRHEIEHYRLCPFNVITHFKMLGTVLNVLKRWSKRQRSESTLIWSKKWAGQIVNQVADVIVDTSNFRRFPEETAVSEQAWIRKTSGDTGIENGFRFQKMMFLLKQSLWCRDLGVYESDQTLRYEVDNLTHLFKSVDMTDLDVLQELTEAYAMAMIRLFRKDMAEWQGKQQMSISSTHVLGTSLADSNSSGNSSGPKNSGDSGELEDSDASKPSNEEHDNTNSENSEDPHQATPTKNGNDGQEELVLLDTDQVDEAIGQLAQEISLEEFSDILACAGIPQLSDSDKKKIWFEQRSVDSIPLEVPVAKGSRQGITYPVPWRLGHPVEDLDVGLSLQVSPRIIPGITTKQWERQIVDLPMDEKKEADLLLVIDRSGSMGKTTQPTSKLHVALLASFGFIKYFEQKGSQISLITFSTNFLVVDWTKSYDLIKEGLLTEGGGGTVFPDEQIDEQLQKKSENTVIVIITDGEIKNWKSTLSLFRIIMAKGNKIFLFLIKAGGIDRYHELAQFGGVVEAVQNLDEIRNLVFSNI
jgi:hypothetical protein